MKRIETVIRPHKEPNVLAALARLGITNATVVEARGLANLPSFSLIYEPTSQHKETGTGLVPKRLLLVFVEDDQVQPAVEAIQSVAFTGTSGDGVITVSQLDQVIRIRPKGKPHPAK